MKSKCLDIFYRSPQQDGMAAMEIVQANHLVTACLLAIINFAAYSLLYQWLGEHGNAIICGVGTGLCVAFLVMARLVRWVAAVREAMILTVFALLLMMTWRLGGITATTVIWLVCCPIIATLTGGMGSGLTWAAISIVAAGWVYAWPATGVVTPPPILNQESIEILAVVSSVSLSLTLATFAAIFELRQRRSIVQLESALAKIEQVAIRDDLTKLFNRRHLMTLIERERSRTSRDGSPFCLCLIDIDHFKQINDRFGHHVGDQVLAEFARRLSNLIRSTDYLGRYGGEEFMLVLTGTDESQALRLTERIRLGIESSYFSCLPDGYTLTASFGVAVFDDRWTADDNLVRADRALYDAKGGGRNAVRLSNSANA